MRSEAVVHEPVTAPRGLQHGGVAARLSPSPSPFDPSEASCAPAPTRVPSLLTRPVVFTMGEAEYMGTLGTARHTLTRCQPGHALDARGHSKRTGHQAILSRHAPACATLRTPYPSSSDPAVVCAARTPCRGNLFFLQVHLWYLRYRVGTGCICPKNLSRYGRGRRLQHSPYQNLGSPKGYTSSDPVRFMGGSIVNPIVYSVTRKTNLFLYQNFKTVCGKDKIFTDNVRKICGYRKIAENVRKMCGNLGKSRIVKYHIRMNGLQGAWIAIRS